VPAGLGAIVAARVDVAPALRWGVALGLIGGFAATLTAAGYLSIHGTHVVGVHPAGGTTLPVVGWSMVAGDLRPAHFVALHMMQVVPLAGWLLLRWHGDAPVWPVVMLAATLLALTALSFLQALRGLPLTGSRSQ